MLQVGGEEWRHDSVRGAVVVAVAAIGLVGDSCDPAARAGEHLFRASAILPAVYAALRRYARANLFPSSHVHGGRAPEDLSAPVRG